jgi:hypothetical protein
MTSQRQKLLSKDVEGDEVGTGRVREQFKERSVEICSPMNRQLYPSEFKIIADFEPCDRIS